MKSTNESHVPRDLEKLDEPVTKIKAHDDFINAVDGCGGLGNGGGAPEIATASKDGTVKVWDPRVRDRAVACVRPAEGQKARDAWSVAFGNCHGGGGDRTLAAGYDNGDVKLFDLKAMKVSWETTLPNGVCSLQFDRSDIEMNKLLATCLEGRFHVWDLRTRHEEKGFARLDSRLEHSTATVWDGRHLPQNRDLFMLAAGSGEMSLWQYEYPDKRSAAVEESGEKEGMPAGRVTKLQEGQIGDQPVASFSWSPDKAGLGLCVSFDQKVTVVIVTKLNML